jgi:hypothetical protein
MGQRGAHVCQWGLVRPLIWREVRNSRSASIDGQGIVRDCRGMAITLPFSGLDYLLIGELVLLPWFWQFRTPPRECRRH